MKLFSRILGFTLAALLAAWQLPPCAAAAWDGSVLTPELKDGVYHITGAAELTWFAQAVNSGQTAVQAVLESDIDLSGIAWTPAGTQDAPFAGVLDGAGYSVTGLSVNSSAASACLGLFGALGGEGRVLNLQVGGTVASTGSGAYAGGIAGINEGLIEGCTAAVSVSGRNAAAGVAGSNKGCIRSCVNRGAIVGEPASYTAGIAGIAGLTSGGAIEYSVNHGTVSNPKSSYGYYTGGIVGRASGGFAITGVYNRGDVSGYNNVGGILGAGEGSGRLRCAYSTGTVTSTYPSSYPNYKGGIAGRTSSNQCDSVYFLQEAGVNQDLKAVGSGTAQNAEGKTEAELKNPALLSGLGGIFEADLAENINQGYPILKWQNPNAAFQIVFSVSPADASVTLTHEGQTLTGAVQDGEQFKTVTYSNLAKGDYSYRITQDTDDYAEESGVIPVGSADIYQTVALKANVYPLVFHVTPKHSEFTLTAQGNALSPQKSETDTGAVYSYALPGGDYRYAAQCFAFLPEQGQVTINRAGQDKTVSLGQAPCAAVTFSLTEQDSGAEIPAPKIQLRLGETLVAPQAYGSYLLPAGRYGYVVKKSGYAKVSGSLEITDADLNGQKEIALTTCASGMWDGESLDEPPYQDGVWQISTGNELAWFAAYVNGVETASPASATQDAVLLDDIDLGGYSWTPIGAKTGYSTKQFQGTFHGNHKSVSGLFINTSTEQQGLFGKTALTATIRDLTVSGSVFSSYTGTYAYIGGICGYNQGSILGCINRAEVLGNGGYIGGICGYSSGGYSDSAVIESCGNEGLVGCREGTGQLKGGIAGEASYTNITQCYNRAEIRSNGNLTGGIVGQMRSGAYLTDCYNTGNITARAFAVGGLAGKSNGSSSNSGITNCYTAGEVKEGLQNFGAFLGDYNGGKIENCYCLIEENGINAGLRAVGIEETTLPAPIVVKSAADQMKTALFDNSGSWKQNGFFNQGYPYLSWQSVAEKTVLLDGRAVDLSMALPRGVHTITAAFASEIQEGTLFLGVYQGNRLLALALCQNAAGGSYRCILTQDLPSAAEVKVFFLGGDSLTPLDSPVRLQVE